MDIKKFIPPLDQISREAIAVLIATLGVAWLISKSPALKKLVKENTLG